MKNYAVWLVLFLLTPFIDMNGFAQEIQIGDLAPLKSEKLKNIDGKMKAIEEFNEKNGYMVVFSCNTCPFVIGGDAFDGWEKNYNTLYKRAESVGVGMVLINSNEAKRNEGDGLKDMKSRADEYKYEMDYLMDENHKLADAFGAKTTPHVFIFDNNHKLIYKGAIDNTWNPKVKQVEHYVINVLRSVVSGDEIEKGETPPKGCSIKRL